MFSKPFVNEIKVPTSRDPFKHTRKETAKLLKMYWRPARSSSRNWELIKDRFPYPVEFKEGEVTDHLYREHKTYWYLEIKCKGRTLPIQIFCFNHNLYSNADDIDEYVESYVAEVPSWLPFILWDYRD